MARNDKESTDVTGEGTVTDVVRKLSGVGPDEEARVVELGNPFSGELMRNDEAIWKRTDLDSLDFSQISIEDLAVLGAELGLSASDISAMVDKWPLFDKAELERKETPLTLFQWKFGQGRFAKEGEDGYVMIWARREDTGAQGTIYDGGSGIKEQMKALTARRLAEGKAAYNLATVSSLTRSDYTYTDADGNETPATTYYLS